MDKMDFTQEEVNGAFERLRVWLKERELPAGDDQLGKYMLMCQSSGNYQFKNCNTRNYLFVNVEPKAFNL